jgi:hypothetical protein
MVHGIITGRQRRDLPENVRMSISNMLTMGRLRWLPNLNSDEG